MKDQNKTNKGIKTASWYRKQRRETLICTILRVVLVLSLIFFGWIVNLGCAFGWIRNARAGENWPLEFVGYGQMMVVASIFLTVAAVLVLLRRHGWLNWTAVGVGSVGMTLCLIALYRVSSYAADSGFYSMLMDMEASRLYQLQILPTIIPFGCIVLLAVMQSVSVDAKSGRNAKRKQEEEKAPSVFE